MNVNRCFSCGLESEGCTIICPTCIVKKNKTILIELFFLEWELDNVLGRIKSIKENLKSNKDLKNRVKSLELQAKLCSSIVKTRKYKMLFRELEKNE